jgi:hypothetical protein
MLGDIRPVAAEPADSPVREECHRCRSMSACALTTLIAVIPQSDHPSDAVVRNVSIVARGGAGRCW